MTRKKTTHNSAKEKSFGLTSPLPPFYPCSENVTTKVGKFFLRIIDKHFPPHNRLHKLFNRNNVKISYRCLPNRKSIKNAPNWKVLYLSPTIGRRTASIYQCPLQQNFLSNILYQPNIAPVDESSKIKVYMKQNSN